MPKLGQTMEEGTIVNTLVKVGEKINKGDVLFKLRPTKQRSKPILPTKASSR